MSEVIKEFMLQDGTKLRITDAALKHIIYGEVNTRPQSTTVGRTAIKVLAGGLHTVSGWESFKAEHPNLKNLYSYISTKDSDWFYARELQNDVILLKLPADLITSKAAKMTRYPENYYKSGYLWKTLFPKYINESNIVDMINSVFQNINYKESSGGELIGYLNCKEVLKMIRVVILHRDGYINSVYPSWDQPNTGNNGKPFSYFDNIGHVVASSIVFFKGDNHIDERDSLLNGSLFENSKNINDICGATPEIFLQRTLPTDDLDLWRKERIDALKAYAESSDRDAVGLIYSYLTDGMICKRNFDYFSGLVSHFGIDSLDTLEKTNAVLYEQNIIDGLYIVYFSRFNEELFSPLTVFLLKNMVTYLFIDSWSKRRIHTCILELCVKSGSDVLLIEYLKSFSTSPSRRELLIEYDYESLDKRKAFFAGYEIDNLPIEFGIIKRPPINQALSIADFLGYLRDNLGESYSFIFNEEGRRGFVAEYLQDSDMVSMIKLHLSYISEKDFYLFGQEMWYLSETYIKLVEVLDEKPFISIIRDYCKIQFAQRLRTNLNYKEFSDIEALPFPDAGEEYLYALILKHERISNHDRVDIFLDSMQIIASHYSNANLNTIITEYRLANGKERPKLPNNIKRIYDDLGIGRMGTA